jgi:hypothetical protein
MAEKRQNTRQNVPQQNINATKITTLTSWASLITAIATLFTVGLIAIQTCSLNKQVDLNNKQTELQLASTRPFIHIEPRSSANIERNIIRIEYVLVNESGVPGNVICTQQKMSFIGSKSDRSGKDDCATPRIIYKESRGFFSLVSLTSRLENSQELIQGRARIEMAACVIYESVSKSDPRRWKATSRHVFRNGAFDTHGFTEEEVSTNEKQCSIEVPYGN